MKKIICLIICLSMLAFCLLGCEPSNTPPTEDPPPETTQLSAPEIALDGKAISWQAVDHASGYEVYEGTTKLTSVTATSYTITQDIPGTYAYTVYAISADSAYTKSAASNAVSYTVTARQLSAPVLSLRGTNTLVWDGVEHATSYEVFEGESKVQDTETTTYTIAKTVDGEYTYTVYALSTDVRYSKSPASNAVKYTYESVKIQLAAPLLTLMENVLSWEKIDHAESYEIYYEGELEVTTTELSYTIPYTEVGSYNYSVKAITTEAGYENSAMSEVQTFVIPPQSLKFEVTLELPSNYNITTIQIALFHKDRVVEGTVRELTKEHFADTITYEDMPIASYRARAISSVLNGYMVVPAVLNASVTSGRIIIQPIPAGKRMQVGRNTVYASEDQVGNVSDPNFVWYLEVPADGIYTFTADRSANIDISVDGTLMLQPSQGWTTTTMQLFKGACEIVILVNSAGSHAFTIMKGEPEHRELRIGTGYGDNNANFVYDADMGSWELTVTDARYYEFFFGPAIDGKNVTITLTGSNNKPQEFIFNTSGEGEGLNVHKTIGLNADTYKVEVSIDEPSEEFTYVAFFIYPLK